MIFLNVKSPLKTWYAFNFQTVIFLSLDFMLNLPEKAMLLREAS